MATAAKKPAQLLPVAEVTLIPLKELEVHPCNVRKAEPAHIEALAESIAARGMLHNLVVTPKPADVGPGFYVIDGGRRLLALAHLNNTVRAKSTDLIPCTIRDDASAVLVSLAANVQREQLSPIDEAVAFAELVKAGQKLRAIQAEFGISARYLKQRLALASVHPEILAAARNGDMPLEVLEAFTTTDDHARQLAVWSEICGQAHDIEPEDVRNELHAEAIDVDAPLAVYVGIDAYTEAGGKMVADLFADDDAAKILADGALLRKLAAKKLRKEAKRYEGQGWAWVDVATEPDATYNMHAVDTVRRDPTDAERAERERLEAERETLAELIDQWTDEQRARDDALEARIDELDDALDVIPDEAKALSGVLLYVKWNGQAGAKLGVLRGTESMQAYAKLRAARRKAIEKPAPAKKEPVNHDENVDKENAVALVSERKEAFRLMRAARVDVAEVRECLVLGAPITPAEIIAKLGAAVEVLDVLLLKE